MRGCQQDKKAVQTMDLDTLKTHIRVDHDFEDALIESYKTWAEEEIKDSVTTDPRRDNNYFEGNAHYEKAVILLTSHYYHNRLPMIGVTRQNPANILLPFAIHGAIQKLRGGYHATKQS